MNRPTPPARVRAPFASAHCVGIGGSGMTALAELLLDGDCRVTGSDLAAGEDCQRQWHSRGVRIDPSHAGEHVPSNVEALIYSPAIPAENPERRRAAECGIPQYSLPQALRMLMRDRVGIGVAGTHGKSTTTAMIAWILQHAGCKPSAYIGGKLCGTERGGWLGNGEFFVAESCEYQRNFLHLEPQHAVVLGVEPDHFDTFPDDETLIETFAEFCRRIPEDGQLIVSADCHGALAAAHRGGLAFTTFGHFQQADWRIDAVQQTKSGMQFCVFNEGERFAEIEVPLFGRHNVHNATAAVAMCASLGLSAESIRNALAEFPGVCRRLEHVGTWEEVTFFDDYAHHPTAVRVTLETLREVFPGRRLWCIFQPHQVARVRRMEREFAEALGIADRVDVLPVYSARETASDVAADASRRLVERCTGWLGSTSGSPQRTRSLGATLRSDPSHPSDTPSETNSGPWSPHPGPLPRNQTEMQSAHIAGERGTESPRAVGERRNVDVRFCSSLDRILPTIDHEARPGDVVVLMGAGDIERIRHELARRIPRDHANQ